MRVRVVGRSFRHLPAGSEAVVGESVNGRWHSVMAVLRRFTPVLFPVALMGRHSRAVWPAVGRRSLWAAAVVTGRTIGECPSGRR